MNVILYNGQPAITDQSGKVLFSELDCRIRHTDAPRGTTASYDVVGQWELTQTPEGWYAQKGNASLCFRQEHEGIRIQSAFTADRDFVHGDSLVISGQLADHPRTLIAAKPTATNGNRTNEMQAPVKTLTFGEEDSFNCADYGAYQAVSGKCYIAGFLSYREYFGSVYIYGDGRVDILQFLEYHPIAQGETLQGDWFYFTQCADLQTGLPEYAQYVADEMMPADFKLRKDIPAGFCTWYYYLPKITSGVLDNSVRDAKANKDKLPIRYIQIDSGWYDYHGDWLPNKKFPQGMKAEADKIREAGFIPGLWFAPLIVEKESELFKAHPDYCLKNWGEEGPRVGDYEMYNLDISKKESQDILREIFRRATEDWGFEYLKLDAVTNSIGPYKHHDPSFNAVKSYRKMLEVIRESTPEGTFILSCTAPFGPAVGLADGMRISVDVGGGWDSVCEMYNDVIKRWFYSNRMFINDADCLLVRKAENEDEECGRNCTRTDEEIRTYINATAASGGILMLSDKLSLLSEEQLQQLSYLLPLNTEPAVPLDLLTAQIPGVLDSGVHEGIRTVTLINWEDQPKTMQIEAAGGRAYAFWEQKYLGVQDQVCRIELQPHCSEVIFISQADQPGVVGTDSALTPKIAQKYEKGQLTFTFEKQGETLFLAADKVSSDEVELRKVEDGLFAVTQTGEKMTYTIQAE